MSQIVWDRSVYCPQRQNYTHICHICPPSGDGPGCEEGDSPAVQAEGQVLPGGRDRGADPGRHQEALLPAGEGGHPGRGDLLPSRVCRAAGLLRHPGKVRAVQQVSAPPGLPVLRAPAAQKVSVKQTLHFTSL